MFDQLQPEIDPQKTGSSKVEFIEKTLLTFNRTKLD